MDEGWNFKSRTDALSYKRLWKLFRFIVALIVVRKVLGYMRPLTKTLQAVEHDFARAKNDVQELRNVIADLRSKIDECHETWYNEAVALASTVDSAPTKSRTTKKQQHRENYDTQDVISYYRQSLTIPFLDHLEGQLNARFSDSHLNVMDGFYVIPSAVLSNDQWKEKVTAFCNQYVDDLPEPGNVYAELDMWQFQWKRAVSSGQCIPKTVMSALKVCDSHTYPNLSVILRIIGTLPVTTCTCERSVSALRRLKTYMRSTMSDDRLNSIALMHIHRDVDISVEDVIDRFARRNPRRMELVDVLFG